MLSPRRWPRLYGGWPRAARPMVGGDSLRLRPHGTRHATEWDGGDCGRPAGMWGHRIMRRGAGQVSRWAQVDRGDRSRRPWIGVEGASAMRPQSQVLPLARVV